MTNTVNENDQEWLWAEQTARGDERAFEALMQRYQRPVLSFIYRMLNDSSEAEDVAQDVFAKMYRTLRKKGVRRKSSTFSTWLFQVARNTAIDQMRRRDRRPTTSLTAMAEAGWESASTDDDPFRQTVDNELGREIANAIATLPEKQRAVLILYEYEGLSYSAIAEIMGSREKSVEARLYRARHTLRRRLANYL